MGGGEDEVLVFGKSCGALKLCLRKNFGCVVGEERGCLLSGKDVARRVGSRWRGG